MGKLEGKTAIVTGGAIGIGRHYTEALAREGATVAIFDIVDWDQAAATVNSSIGRAACLGFQTDVSDERSVEESISKLLSGNGRIDILVNNAAIYSTLPPVSFTDIEVSQWDKVMAVNLRGPFSYGEVRRTPHDRAELWQDHQHKFGDSIQGNAIDAPLCHLQRWHPRVHTGTIARTRPA